MSKLVKWNELTDEDRYRIASHIANIFLWIMEGRSHKYMADALGISVKELHSNLIELLYAMKNEVGLKQYVKVLFRK